MHLLSAGMEKLTGDKIPKWLERMTRRRLRSAFFVAAATALIQSSGICYPEADVMFTETLRNPERISDHADNLGVSVIRS